VTTSTVGTASRSREMAGTLSTLTTTTIADLVRRRDLEASLALAAVLADVTIDKTVGLRGDTSLVIDFEGFLGAPVPDYHYVTGRVPIHIVTTIPEIHAVRAFVRSRPLVGTVTTRDVRAVVQEREI
jgi:hypothetical protein